MSDSAARVTVPRPVIRGAGTFTPPGQPGSASAPDGAPVPPDVRRAVLLARQKALSGEIRELTAKRVAVEAELAAIDARSNLAKKLGALTPAERALLEADVAEKARVLIEADGAAAGQEPAKVNTDEGSADAPVE